MAGLISISPFDVEDDLRGEYAFSFAPLGFETRSRFVSEQLSPNAVRRFCCSYPDRHSISYSENEKWYHRSGFEKVALRDEDFEEWVFDLLLSNLKATDKPLRLIVDISSLTRVRIAAMVAAFMRLPLTGRMVVDFVYAIAKWEKPDPEPEPILEVGAIRPYFAGWSASPDLPTVAVIGLGYEPDKAVGAYEMLEATAVWAFTPFGTDRRYERAIQKANQPLLQNVRPERHIRYNIISPVACFGILESIAARALNSARPVLLPFGPKLFALNALLVSCVHREIPVWRISSGLLGRPVDRVPSGATVGLRAEFGPVTNRK